MGKWCESEIKGIEMDNIFVILTSIILCGISFYLLIRKKESKTKLLIVYMIASFILVVGLAVMLQFFYVGNALYTNMRMIALVSIMAPIAYVDFTELRIPNEYVIIGIVYWILSIFVEILCGSQFIWMNIISSLIAATALFIAALLCRVCIKGSIGAGDIKLFMVMGLLLELDGIWSAIFLSLVISFIVAVFLLAAKKKNRTDAMAFGPALAIGTWLSIFLTGV